MKNFKFAAPTLAALLVVSMSVFTVFASGPSAGPTGGNVDANFNSLSIGPVGAEALILNSSGELSTKSGDFNPVKINDTYGLRLDSTIKGFESVCTDPSCTAAGYFNSSGNTGVSAVANGAAGMGGSFTGTFLGAYGNGTGAGSTGVSGNGVAKGVAGTATAGVGGQFTGTTYGVQGTASAAGSTGGSFTGNTIGVSGTANSAGAFGVNGSSSGSNGKGVVGSATGDLGIGVFGFVSGAGATTSKGVAGQVNAGAPASAVAGSFVNQNGSNNDAYLGTNSYAVQAAGNSDLQGIILNSSVTSGGEVRIEDTDGFSVTVPTAPVRFKVNGADGGILNPTGTEPVKISDTDGVNIFGALYNPTSYLTLGNPNWNSSDYTGSNYINLNQPIGNYASKPITGGYTATQCQNDAGISSGGTCWFPLILRDEEGIAMTTNVAGPKRQTNLLIGSSGDLSNPGPNNLGRVSVNDPQGLKVLSNWTGSGLNVGNSGTGGAIDAWALNMPDNSDAVRVEWDGTLNGNSGIHVINDGTNGRGIWVQDPYAGSGNTGVYSESTSGNAGYFVNTTAGNAVNLGTPSYSVDATKGARISGTNSSLKLEGTGSVTSGARITLGDPNYAFIEENTDDHINISAPSGINFVGGYNGGGSTNMTVTGNETVTGSTSLNGGVTVNGSSTFNGTSNFNGTINLNNVNLWGWSYSAINTYDLHGNKVSGGQIGKYKVISGSRTLSAWQTFTDCSTGTAPSYYQTIISGGYSLPSGSPIVILGSFPWKAYSFTYGADEWCVKAYNNSGSSQTFTIYAQYFDAGDTSPY